MGFFSALFGAPSQEELDEQDRQLREVEAAYRARQQARIDAAEAEGQDVRQQQAALDARNNIVNQHYDESHIDVEAEIEEGFDEGLQEGARNVTNVLSKPFEIAGAGIGAILKAIPWWLWLLAGAVLFFYVGGPALVLPLLKRKARP
jgi:hypothetical protein